MYTLFLKELKLQPHKHACHLFPTKALRFPSSIIVLDRRQLALLSLPQCLLLLYADCAIFQSLLKKHRSKWTELQCSPSYRNNYRTDVAAKERFYTQRVYCGERLVHHIKRMGEPLHLWKNVRSMCVYVFARVCKLECIEKAPLAIYLVFTIPAFKMELQFICSFGSETSLCLLRYNCSVGEALWCVC